MRLDLLELAWAAGLFDGEGYAGSTKNTSLRLSVDQIDPGVLRRFQAAVGGLGRIYGPYAVARTRRPLWVWQAYRFDHAQAVVAMLWRFLSAVKREQCKQTMVAAQLRPHWGWGGSRPGAGRRKKLLEEV